MKKRMRLLTATLAVVMTMSVCAPAKAAEYDTQQQEVMQEEESVQEEEIVLLADDNKDVVTAENEDADIAVTIEDHSEEAGHDLHEEETSAKEEESPAEPERDKTEQVEEEPETAEENGEDGNIDKSVKEADTPKEQEAPVITDDKDSNMEETRSALKGTDASVQPEPEEIIDTKIKGGTTDGAEKISEEEPLLKIAAPDASDASGGRWEEIIEVINHPEQGHTERVQVGTKTVVDKEAWDEQVYARLAVCSACGYTSDSTEDINNHLHVHYDPDLGYDNASYGVTDVLVETIHHPAVTHEEAVYEDRWVVDSPEWTEKVVVGYYCTECGATK